MSKQNVVSVVDKKKIYGIAFGLLLIALIPTIYFYNQFQNTQRLLQNPSIAAQEELNSLVVRVGRLIELPKNETPTVATVSDVSKLKGQQFFANAVNGDKVLIYEKAKKAILYRPSINRIIEVGPINIGQTATEPQATSSAKVASPTPTPKPITVTIYNGSKTPGLASTTQQKLEGKFSQIKVLSLGNAKGEYQKTIVYDLTGINKSLVSQLAQFLSGEVGTNLSASEAKPSTDLLVVVVK